MRTLSILIITLESLDNVNVSRAEISIFSPIVIHVYRKVYEHPHV